MKRVSQINENIAVWAVSKFNTMGCFWLFAIYGLLGAIPRFMPDQPVLLYWSNYIQLIALPLIGVGMVIIDKRSHDRVKDLHNRHDIHEVSMEEVNGKLDMLLAFSNIHPDKK